MSPVISATPVRRPRKPHTCEACRRPIVGKHVRLYGHAHETDPPYTIRLHPGCAYPTDYKTGKALAALSDLTPDLPPAIPGEPEPLL